MSFSIDYDPLLEYTIPPHHGGKFPVSLHALRFTSRRYHPFTSSTLLVSTPLACTDLFLEDTIHTHHPSLTPHPSFYCGSLLKYNICTLLVFPHPLSLIPGTCCLLKLSIFLVFLSTMEHSWNTPYPQTFRPSLSPPILCGLFLVEAPSF